MNREKLYALLGDLPPLDSKITAQVLHVENREGYRLEKLQLCIEGAENIPAYFVAPINVNKPPVVLYCHFHGAQYQWGKKELLHGVPEELLRGHGIPEEKWPEYAQPPYAGALTDAGYAALCIDSRLFGERAAKTDPSELWSEELWYFIETMWQGTSLWGLMVYDHLRAIDYLHTRTDVDATRLATLGMSMGSNMSWWLAALDTRIKVCVDIMCMTDFRTVLETGGFRGHGLYYFVPGLLKYFETADINALIAPRPHLSLNGIYDPLTPEAGLDKIDAALRKVYADAGAAEAWCMKKYPAGHQETPQMRADVMNFLANWL